MQERGFTLMEMIGAMIILAIIALLATPVISNIIDNSTESAYQQQIENIRQGAKDWAADNIFDLPDVGDEKLVLSMTDDLIAKGYIYKDIVNPKTNKPFNNIEIYIINDNGRILYDIYENGSLLSRDDNRID